LLRTLSWRADDATPVVKKVIKSGAADPIHGRFETTIDGRLVVVEYEPDPELRDSEQVPIQFEGGIDAFLAREVLPFTSDAWYEPAKVKLGYELSFARHFYKPPPLRSLAEIRGEILELGSETQGLLAEIIGAYENA
jgi:type I restriction enzyme M protein